MSGNNVGVFGQDRIERLANEVARRAKEAKDYVAPRGKLAVTVTEQNKLALVVQNGSEHVLPLSPTAASQLAGSLDVPTRFVDRLESRGHADLVAATFSELLSRESRNEKGAERKHLVRVLDGRTRAFLSDKFDRAASNVGLMGVTLEAFGLAGAEVWDFKLDDDTFAIQGIAPGLRMKVEHAIRADVGAHAWARNLDKDWQHPAVSITNSETGRGRSEASLALWTDACRNLAIVSKEVRKVHLGRQLEEGEQDILSEETRELEAKALFSKVRDVIAFAFNEERFRAFMKSLSETTARTLGDEAKASEVVELVTREFKLPGGRAEQILETWLSSGCKSQYWLGQAITACVNPDRAKETPDSERLALERAGGSLLSFGDRDWKAFVRKAHEAAPEEVATQAVALVR